MDKPSIALTDTERKYLWAISQMQSKNIGTKDIEDALKVKKPTANTTLNALTENGFLLKYRDKNNLLYSLSEKGEESLEYYRECYDLVKYVYQSKLHRSLDRAKTDFAEIMSGGFPVNVFSALKQLVGDDFRAPVRKSKNKHPLFENGTYDLPFEVVRPDEDNSGIRKRSMGNSGFLHPAKFVVENENAFVMLTAKSRIEYNGETRMRGALKSFYIKEKEEIWKKLVPQNEYEYIISFDAISAGLGFYKTLSGAFINFKAAATNENMPKDSLGTILFFFDRMTKTLDN